MANPEVLFWVSYYNSILSIVGGVRNVGYMKCKTLLLTIFFTMLSMLNIAVAAPSGSVRITFNAAPALLPTAVPLSPWLNGLIALMLMAVVYFALHRKINHHLLILTITCLGGGVISLSPKTTEAIIALVTLDVSPKSTNITSICVGNTTNQYSYNFVNGVAPNGLIITGVTLVSAPSSTLDPSSTCTVGKVLRNVDQCTVVINTICTPAPG